MASLLLYRMAGLPRGKLTKAALVALLEDPKSDLAQEALPHLVDAALAFRQAGGVWSPHDWLDFSKAEKVAATLAGDRLDVTRARRLGAKCVAIVEGGDGWEAIPP